MDSGFEPLEEDRWSMLMHWARTLSFHHALTRTDSGDVCLRLTDKWTDLLAALASLGPVALLSCHGDCQVTELQTTVDFQPVPGTTELIELNSGISIDTAQWSFALGVEERRQGGSMLGFQFFDPNHEGILKILLTSDSHLLPFRQLLRNHIAQNPQPDWPNPIRETFPPEQAGLNLASVRSSWRQFNPFHPDASAWQNESLQLVEVYEKLGAPYAESADSSELINLVVDAHHLEQPLEILFFRTGLSRRIILTPHRLEKCPCGLHLIDRNAQILLPLQGFHLWSTNYPNSGSKCLEGFDNEGGRLFALKIP